MRLTINLEDDLYAMARSHAVGEGISISRAVNAIMRHRLSGRGADRDRLAESATSYMDPELGILVSRSKGPFSMEDIRRAEHEEDDRHWNLGTAAGAESS